MSTECSYRSGTSVFKPSLRLWGHCGRGAERMEESGMGELLWRALCTYDQSTLQQAAAQMGFRGRVTTKKEATRSGWGGFIKYLYKWEGKVGALGGRWENLGCIWSRCIVYIYELVQELTKDNSFLKNKEWGGDYQSTLIIPRPKQRFIKIPQTRTSNRK